VRPPEGEPQPPVVGEPQPPAPAAGEAPAKLSGSAVVAGGILLSRIAGLVRQRVFAQFFGASLYADAFLAGMRMPNVLQNLLGEGTLSASFIPVYSELLEEGRKEEAGRVAGAVFSLLMVVAGVLALVGVLLAPVMVSVLLPGFEGERRELTIAVIRILFPMTGVLVLSAWSLGVLNSHRSFFLPYFAPVLWNAAMIATLLVFGRGMDMRSLTLALAWGALVGGGLQFAIQLPGVIRLERSLKIAWNTRLEGVRETVRNAGPAIMGRGVVQLSGWVDMFLASLLAVGAVSFIGYAQVLYVLPVSLFGMSVAAAELPELSRQRLGTAEALRERTSLALRRIAFYVVPTCLVFIFLGDVVVAALYQTGEFGRTQTVIVHLTLIGYSLGLVASTGTRLFSSTYFALRDTRSPARFAAVRVGAAAVLAFTMMIQFEPVEIGGMVLGGTLSGFTIEGQALGAVGLALGAGLAAWLEWFLLRRKLRTRIGTVGAGAGPLGRMFLAAGAAVAVGWGVRLLVPPIHPIPYAVLILGAAGVVYMGAAYLLRLGEARMLMGRALRLVRR
jgi:putative peptidoglycan lipid II flippase